MFQWRKSIGKRSVDSEQGRRTRKNRKCIAEAVASSTSALPSNKCGLLVFRVDYRYLPSRNLDVEAHASAPTNRFAHSYLVPLLDVNFPSWGTHGRRNGRGSGSEGPKRKVRSDGMWALQFWNLEFLLWRS